MHAFTASSERQFNTLLEILAEHKVLLDRIVSQNAVINNLMDIFPIKSVEKLKEFDNSLATQADPYVSIFNENKFVQILTIFIYILIETAYQNTSWRKHRKKSAPSVWSRNYYEFQCRWVFRKTTITRLWQCVCGYDR